MSTFPEYEQFDGLGLAELVHTGQVSSLELVEAAIERIEARNPQLNAVIHKMYDEARAAAPKASDSDAQFSGVPFLLKDLLAEYGGVPMRSGSRFFQDYVPQQDSILVQRYKAAGLVVLGKTNTPELGITAVTEPELWGTTNNPWDLSRTVGGSSGGSAAAVAGRFVPMAHAGDGLGSIRIPASCCGLFGLKPTRRRNPRNTDYDAWQGFVCEHVLTRSVRDSAAMLDATAVTDPYFPDAITRNGRPFLQEIGRDPGKLRIAYTAVPFMGDKMDDACLQGLEETVALCRELGHELIEDAPPIDGVEYAKAAMIFLAAEIRADIDEAGRAFGKRPTPDQFEKSTWALGLMGGEMSASSFVQAMRTMQRTAHQIHQFFANYDVLLTPTLAQPPVKSGTVMPTGAEALALQIIGRLRAGSVLKALKMLDTAAADSFRFTPSTPLFNATGQPAMSVPLWWTDDGLPVGMQFIGRFADEATLFRLAGQLEQAQPWFDKVPPVAGEIQ
ncbi:MAG: amidase [Ardenticatenaceae bacterium]|nr:amidase [Ardenticatenaceae bacterium]